MKQNVALSILTPFSTKSAKKWEGAAQKTKLDEGVQGGLEITILCYYLSFVHFFTKVEANVHVLEVKKSIFQGFEKNQPSVFFRIRLFYPILSHEGALVAVRETLSILLCFVSVEWKIGHSKVHSENLST